MLSRAQVKDIQSLHHKKYRDLHGLYVVEGTKLATEAIQYDPDAIETVCVTEEWLSLHADWSAGYSGKLHVADQVTMERISSLQSPPGILLVMKKAEKPLPAQFSGITILLDGIQDPGNLGTIIRTADWFGIQNLILGTGSADVYNPKVIQATMGSLFRVHFWYRDLDQFISEFSSVPVFAADADGDPPGKWPRASDALLLIGNESLGIHPGLLDKATKRIAIPGIGQAESLNAAVATGIILYQMTSFSD